MALEKKNPPARAGNTRDEVSISRSGRSCGVGNGTHSSILSWKIPWAKEPGGCCPWCPKELDTTDQVTHTHVYTYVVLGSEMLSTWSRG